MVNEIIVDASLGETRVAVLEDKELAEIYIERGTQERLLGNIYRGRVCTVLPGMQAAFVDIGYEKNAFLYVGDAVPIKDFSKEYSEEEFVCTDESKTTSYNIEDILRPGQEITVQVMKEPIGTKGPRVSTHITLPGRYLVLVPNAEYVGISRRIDSEEERARLKAIAEKIRPQGMGIIVRTVAEGKNEEDFIHDVGFLTKLWSRIKQKESVSPAPKALHKDMSLLYRAVRDLFTWNIDRFVVNNRDQYTKVLELVEMLSPALKSRVEYFSKSYNIFDYYQVESRITKALARKVWLKNGGYIIIDQTEALTVIDVNTGKFVGSSGLEDTVLKTNLESAREIARQLRLRDIGGIIVIDFIDMHEHEHQEMVLETLRQALRKDRTKTSVIGLTGLGLVEMTRKKVRQRLSSVMSVDCPHCGGTGKILSTETIAHHIEKEIGRFFSQTLAAAIVVEVNPGIAPLLAGHEGRNVARMEQMYGRKIEIRALSDIKYEDVRIHEGSESMPNADKIDKTDKSDKMDKVRITGEMKVDFENNVC